MSKKKNELGMAPVARLAHVKQGIRVSSDSVEMVLLEAESYIKEVFTGALAFTEHRKGTMIMKQDVEAYFRSLKS